jgi:hypothetical protein
MERNGSALPLELFSHSKANNVSMQVWRRWWKGGINTHCSLEPLLSIGLRIVGVGGNHSSGNNRNGACMQREGGNSQNESGGDGPIEL